MIKYSFVIPVYNNKKALKNALLSLNNQKKSGSYDYEVIVVDDGSDEDTSKYINGVNRDYELKYIYCERSKSCRAKARNMGWQEAKGKVAVFIDADIIVKQDYLAELDRCFSLSEDIAVMGTRLLLPKGLIIDLETLFELYDFQSKFINILEVRHFIFDILSYNMSCVRWPGLLLCTCNAAVPVKYLHAIGGFDTNFIGWGMEDTDLGYRLGLLDKLKIVVNPRLEVLHQYHPHLESSNKEYDLNKEYFLSKFPFTWDGTPMSEALGINSMLFQAENSYRKKYSQNGKQNTNKVELQLKDPAEFQGLKEAISKISLQQNIDISVIDYTETTDLDIWIQLLGVRNSTPEYRPISRKLKKLKISEIDRYVLSHMI